MRAIHLRVGLPAELPATVTRLIKRADRLAAYLEATQIAGFAAAEARGVFGAPRTGGDILIEPVPPDEVKRRYIDRFRVLGGTTSC